jgi:hypothetical protein
MKRIGTSGPLQCGQRGGFPVSSLMRNLRMRRQF